MTELNDVEFEAQKARVTRIIDKWYGPMDLNWCRLELVWLRGEGPVDNDGSNFQTYATTATLWEYRRARIKFYLACFSALSDEDAEGMVVHELVHIAIDEAVKDCWNDKGQFQHKHMERVVESLARAFIYVREVGEGKRDAEGCRITARAQDRSIASLCEGESR